MITYVDFSLFDSPAKVLVNTVNTVGVMGKGIAKEFKSIYPDMFKEYQQLCERGMLDIGDLWVHKTPHKWVLNFPTKRNWRRPSKPEYLEEGLQKFAQVYQEARITSISFPQLGCGNGELDWKTESKPLMEKYLEGLPIEIFIHVVYAGSGFRPEHRVPKTTRDWLRAEPQSLAFSEVWDDLVNTVGSQKRFATLENSVTFDAVIFDDTDGEGIEIVDGENTVRLHKEQLLDLWQQVREMGICIPRLMPSGLDSHSEYVVGLLSELQYFERMHQARSDTQLSRSAVGLLLKHSQGTRDVDLRNTSAIESEARQLQLV
jgi:O-acetyl-ADP-ribose deacetylase (regulator of RNase III)